MPRLLDTILGGGNGVDIADGNAKANVSKERWRKNVCMMRLAGAFLNELNALAPPCTYNVKRTMRTLSPSKNIKHVKSVVPGAKSDHTKG